MLRKFKDEKRTVPLPAAFHIAIEIVRALDFAHAQRRAPRRVPSNVLISRAGEVKLGLRIAVAAQPTAAAARAAQGMGKWRLHVAEQTRGDLLDTRSDLFSAAWSSTSCSRARSCSPATRPRRSSKNIDAMPIPRMSALRPACPRASTT